MPAFPTERKESHQTRLWRLMYNLLPPIRGTGSWLTFLSGDWQEAHLRLGLNLRTRNYVGTIFGGAMFAATDPMYMVMLIKILGKDYVVWDKAGRIRFLKPGRERLVARFEIPPERIEAIRSKVAETGAVDESFTVTWLDKAGKPVARIEKTIYIATQAYHEQRIAARGRGA
jgi:acyl-coenzyme A thioesterase PaaI-like protein